MKRLTGIGGREHLGITRVSLYLDRGSRDESHPVMEATQNRKRNQTLRFELQQPPSYTCNPL